MASTAAARSVTRAGAIVSPAWAATTPVICATAASGPATATGRSRGSDVTAGHVKASRTSPTIAAAPTASAIARATGVLPDVAGVALMETLQEKTNIRSL